MFPLVEAFAFAMKLFSFLSTSGECGNDSLQQFKLSNIRWQFARGKLSTIA